MTSADEPVVVGTRLALEIERVAPGGHCVAHHDGRVVFVRHTLPGERVSAMVTEVRSGYLRADAVEVDRPAPGRVTPPCRYAGPGGCGGCDWQHADAATQRQLKAATVSELLHRVGRLTEEQVDDLQVRVIELPGGLLGWRSRVRYAVGRDGRAGFRQHRSHRVVAVQECLIATAAVRELPVTTQRWPRHAEVAVAAAGSGEQHAVLSHVEVPGRRGVSRTRLVDGSAELSETALGRRFTVPAEAFWQVHPAAPDTLATAALELLQPRPGERCWDLYGGVGLFSAALAGAVGPDGSVTMVESGRAAVRAAKRNLADLPQVRTVPGQVERVLAQLSGAGAEVVLLDPPRSGAGREVVSALVAVRPRAICYVACDPAALARDTATFAELGWQLRTLRAYDAFPMTQHVECVALFQPGVG